MTEVSGNGKLATISFKASSSNKDCWTYACTPFSHSTKLSNPISPANAETTSFIVSLQGLVVNVTSKYFISLYAIWFGHKDRNFIRNNITPLLKNRFPQILTNTYKTSQNLCADKRVLDAYYESELSSKLESVQWGKKAVLYSALLNYSDDFKLGILHYFFKSRYGIVPTKSQLLAILNYESIASDSKFKLDVGTNIISVYRDYIYVAHSIEKKNDEQVIELTISNSFTYNGYSYKLILLTDVEVDSIKANNEQSAIDIYYLSNINESITLCFNPRVSIRVHPFYRNHSQTLKNIWKEIGIPLYLRPNYPIVMKDNNVLGMLNVFKCKGVEKDKIKVMVVKEYVGAGSLNKKSF